MGYLVLILLIVEGGLDARLDVLSERRNMGVCVLVAFSGLGFSIGLSILVLYFSCSYVILGSFVIGVALNTTSLGTTFAIMSAFIFPTPRCYPHGEVVDMGRSGRTVSSKDLDQSRLGDTWAGTTLWVRPCSTISLVPGLVMSCRTLAQHTLDRKSRDGLSPDQLFRPRACFWRLLDRLLSTSESIPSSSHFSCPVRIIGCLILVVDEYTSPPTKHYSFSSPLFLHMSIRSRITSALPCSSALPTLVVS